VILALDAAPLAFGDAAARWYHVLLRGLGPRGYEVSAFAACASERDAADATKQFPRPEYDLHCYVRPPARAGGAAQRLRTLLEPQAYLFTTEMRRDLEAALAGGYDVLHLEHNWAGWLAPRNPSRTLLAVHFLARVDLASAAGGTLADRVRRHALVRAERRLLRRFRHITAVTPELAERVRAIAPRARVSPVPLALDLDLYEFTDSKPPNEPPTVGLIGSFGWEPTYAAGVRLVQRLWPEIKHRVPEARLMIVGRGARRALGRLVGSDVAVLEDVPVIAPHFRDLDVMLYAPPAGTGMKVKVLEAFAFGTPVVTNANGAEGLTLEDGVHAGLAEDDAGLIQRTVTLLRNPAKRDAQRRAARSLVATHCAPGRVLDQLDAVYAACA
jgi:glycosyltransferase involved in cell wall biosynthesis